MLRVTGLDHVQVAIPVGGESEARRFYGGLLGLTEVPKPPALAARGGCWFVGKGVHLHLGVEERFRSARKAHIALLVENIDVARAELSAAGMPLSEDDASIGVRRFYVDDPFGNRIEIVDRRDQGFTLRHADHYGTAG